MGRLIYFAMTSLDGLIEDAQGGFGWAEPDTEVHQLANNEAKKVSTQLLGRRMYEVMSFWETAPTSVSSDADPFEKVMAELWRGNEKIVSCSHER